MILFLKRLWESLISPNFIPASSEEYRNSRLIAALIIILFIAFSINVIFIGEISWWVLPAYGIAYLLNKYVSNNAAIFLTFTIFAIPIYQFIFSLTEYSTSPMTSSLMWLALIFLLANLIFKPHQFLLFFGLNLGFIALLPNLIPNLKIQ